MGEFFNRRVRIENKILKAVEKSKIELETIYEIELKKERSRLEFQFNAEINRLRNVVVEQERIIAELRKRDEPRQHSRDDMEIQKNILSKLNRGILLRVTRTYKEIEDEIQTAENLITADSKIKEV